MTRLFNDLPIHWKLVVVTLLTSVIAQLLAGAVLATYDTRTFRARKIREVSAAAAILAASVTASLAFDDAQAADEYLDSVKANPEIAAAAVYGGDARLFASYTRRGRNAAPVPATVGRLGEAFEGNVLTVVVPVVQDADRLGTVYLRAITEPLVTRLLGYIGILLLATLGSLALAVPIAMLLNREIANPIREIAAAASRIAAGDLKLELSPTRRRDEVGRLNQAFRRMVQSLREMTGELERRVQQRTAQLEAANKELEAFSYSVSHDLRAPLRAIDGFARILEEDYAERLDDEGRRLMSVVRNNGRRMGALIDDLLAFSRIGRQSISFAPVDMTALAREVWAELAADGLDRSAAFSLRALPAAQGDRSLLKQVWTNLLSNAAKYSGARPAPAIMVSAEEGERDTVYCVEDNGAGFDMKYYGKLFGVFQRLHSAQQYPGTGVGLAIVQCIVVRHGGRVWAEGEVDHGARFYFSLPRPAPVVAPVAAAAQSPSAVATLAASSAGS